MIVKRGKWEEEDLAQYDGYHNRGKIMDLWEEAFPIHNEEAKWTEFIQLFYGMSDHEVVLESLGNIDEELTEILRENTEDALTNVQVQWS